MRYAVCRICGNTFDYKPSNRSGKYCSWKCYNKSKYGKSNSNYRDGGLRYCQKCGKEYRSYDSRRKHCSISCSLKNQVLKTCEWCKKEFSIQRSKQQKRFCSSTCFNQYINQTGRMPKVCENCHKEFSVQKSMSRIKFCSIACLAIARKSMYAGPGNPRWIGGTTDYRGEDWDAQRNKSFERDTGTCQKCGEQGQVEVHHIIPWRTSKSNNLENLICLCKSCHQKEEGFYRQFNTPSLFLKNLYKREELIQ